MSATGQAGGKTAVIPCLNGFTAEVRLIEAYYARNDWSGVLISLVHKDFPVNHQAAREFFDLFKKDDPTKKIFGIYPFGGGVSNVKPVSYTGNPTKDDVIHIRYDKQERTVSFKCSTFEYR